MGKAVKVGKVLKVVQSTKACVGREGCMKVVKPVNVLKCEEIGQFVKF